MKTRTWDLHTILSAIHECAIVFPQPVAITGVGLHTRLQRVKAFKSFFKLAS